MRLLVPGDGIGPEVMNAVLRVAGSLGRDGLAQLPQGAMVVNTPRGQVMAPEAPVEALDRGTVAASRCPVRGQTQ